MTPEQRTAEFNALFESLPGKNTERLRLVAEAVVCKVNTVRIWRLKDTHRVIPESKLTLLRRHLAKNA